MDNELSKDTRSIKFVTEMRCLIRERKTQISTISTVEDMGICFSHPSFSTVVAFLVAKTGNAYELTVCRYIIICFIIHRRLCRYIIFALLLTQYCFDLLPSQRYFQIEMHHIIQDWDVLVQVDMEFNNCFDSLLSQRYFQLEMHYIIQDWDVLVQADTEINNKFQSKKWVSVYF